MAHTNKFAHLLSKFFTEYLPSQRNASYQTIASYRDTFKIIFTYFDTVKNIKPEKIKLEDFSDSLVYDFLSWIKAERKCSITTRNQRLAAIRSFFRFVQFEIPDNLEQFNKILSISRKKFQKKVMQYLTTDQIKCILSCLDKNKSRERKDLCMLVFLYDSGCRVQELIDIKVRDLVLKPKGIATLTGKGNKVRRIPIDNRTTELLELYFNEKHYNDINNLDKQVFTNNRGDKLTREGVAYIISKYIKRAREIDPSIPEKINPHMFRHSRAMAMLQAGISLIYIRDFLGHTDLKTTEIYARADTELKRKAIDDVMPAVIDDPASAKEWTEDSSLMEWLKSL